MRPQYYSGADDRFLSSAGPLPPTNALAGAQFPCFTLIRPAVVPKPAGVRDKKVDERGNAPIRSRERKKAVDGPTRTWHRPAPQRHTVWPPKRAVASIAIGCCRGAPIASDSVPPASCDSDGGWHRS